MPEAFLFDGLLARPISSNGDCYSAPEADAHGDAPAAPTPTPTATSPADSHDEDIHSDDEREFFEHVGAVLASFGARVLAMLGEIRAWTSDENRPTTEPFKDVILDSSKDVQMSSFGCRYYGGGLATSDFEV